MSRDKKNPAFYLWEATKGLNKRSPPYSTVFEFFLKMLGLSSCFFPANSNKRQTADVFFLHGQTERMIKKCLQSKSRMLLFHFKEPVRSLFKGQYLEKSMAFYRMRYCFRPRQWTANGHFFIFSSHFAPPRMQTASVQGNPFEISLDLGIYKHGSTFIPNLSRLR